MNKAGIRALHRMETKMQRMKKRLDKLWAAEKKRKIADEIDEASYYLSWVIDFVSRAAKLGKEGEQVSCGRTRCE